MSDVAVRVTQETYPILGTSRSEILRSIERRGPRKNGDRYVAYTTWDIGWDYDLRPEGGTVRVVRPRVHVSAHVILPTWREKHKAGGDLVQSWNRAIEAITSHESEHIALGMQAGHRVLDRLRRIAPSRSLDRAAVDDVARQEIAVIQAREKKHDRDTKNGLTQGTWI